jgi:hypothetical protein
MRLVPEAAICKYDELMLAIVGHESAGLFRVNRIFNSRSSTARLRRLQIVALDVAPRSFQNRSR